MSENHKYYYMKLKETFFDSEEMKIIESVQNGIVYQNIYLKLCLLSLKSDGALIFKDVLPYDFRMLSTVLRSDVDVIKGAVKLFHQLGLVEILDNGTIYLSDIQTLVGRSSTEGDRVAKYRRKIKGVQMYDIRTPELELELELEKEKEKEEAPLHIDSEEGQERTMSDKSNSLDIEKEKEEACHPKKDPRVKRGEFENVLLSDTDLKRLEERYGPEATKALIEKMSRYCAQKAKSYKNFYAALLNWADRDKMKEVERIETCKHCGRILTEGICRNPECPQYKDGGDDKDGKYESR